MPTLFGIVLIIVIWEYFKRKNFSLKSIYDSSLIDIRRKINFVIRNQAYYFSNIFESEDVPGWQINTLDELMEVKVFRLFCIYPCFIRVRSNNEDTYLLKDPRVIKMVEKELDILIKEIGKKKKEEEERKDNFIKESLRW